MLFKCENPVEVTKEAYWLAWQASQVVGMGRYEDRPNATKDEVWGIVSNPSLTGAQADYVFGRMMKLRVSITTEGVEIPESEPRADYQSWCRNYPTYLSLFEVAATSIHS